MAKEPKAAFLFSDSGFSEISYKKFAEKYKSDKSYMESHFFIRSGDYLMEVSMEEYKEHYRERRRQKYLGELASDNGDVSFDALTTAEFNGEDALPDTSEDVAERVSRKLLLDKLRQLLPLLSQAEQTLVHEVFYEELSERELAAKYGVSQVAIHKRKVRILDKLRKLIKI